MEREISAAEQASAAQDPAWLARVDQLWREAEELGRICHVSPWDVAVPDEPAQGDVRRQARRPTRRPGPRWRGSSGSRSPR